MAPTGTGQCWVNVKKTSCFLHQLISPCAVEDRQPTVGERWWKLTPKKKRLKKACLPLSAALKKPRVLGFQLVNHPLKLFIILSPFRCNTTSLLQLSLLASAWNEVYGKPVGESCPPSTVVHVCGSGSAVYVDPSSALMIGKHWNLQNRSSHWLKWAEMNGLQSLLWLLLGRMLTSNRSFGDHWHKLISLNHPPPYLYYLIVHVK